MNIKETIGERIQSERKIKGLTQAKLAELAGDLTQPRVNNWERGIRTPGLEEIKRLAEVLEVSPAYLMCLTDRKQIHPMDKSYIGRQVPLLTWEQAENPNFWIQTIMENKYEGGISFIPISIELAKIAGENAFALKMEDESMDPELKLNDLLIISPHHNPKPGNLVVAKIEGGTGIVIRRYKQLSISKSEQQFELLAINKHWPNIQNNELTRCQLLGTVMYLNRQVV